MPELTPSKKTYKRKYYANNKDHILADRKDWYERNKETIKEKRNVLINCNCGLSVTKSYYHQHLDTLKHQELLTHIQKQKDIVNIVNAYLNRNI